MWRPSVTPSQVIRHSQDEWLDHKYVLKKDGKYYYPNSYQDGRTISDLKGERLSDDDVKKIASETMKGQHGNGEERKKKFGDDYGRIQNEVNKQSGSSKRHEEEKQTYSAWEIEFGRDNLSERGEDFLARIRRRLSDTEGFLLRENLQESSRADLTKRKERLEQVLRNEIE